MNTIKVLGFFCLLGVVSCQSTKKAEEFGDSMDQSLETFFRITDAPIAVNDAARQPLEDLKLSLDWDPYDFHVNVATESKEAVLQQLSAEHCVVVDVGNALAIDGWGHWYIDLVRLYDLRDAKKFRVVQKQTNEGLVPNGVWEKDGQTFTVKMAMARSNIGSFTADRLELLPQGQAGERSFVIRKQPDSIVFDRVTRSRFLGLKKPSDTEVSWGGFGGVQLSMPEPNTVVLTRSVDTFIYTLTLTKADDRLKLFEHSTRGEPDLTLTFIKTAKGAQIFQTIVDEGVFKTHVKNLGYTIRRDGNTIRVIEGNDLLETYEIEDLVP